MPNHLSQLTYYSTFNKDEKVDLKHLLETAQTYNKENAITGALWVYKSYYIQVLEGDRRTLSDLYNRISRDNRHKDVVLVGFQAIEERDFPDWWMAYIMDSEKNQQSILKYSCGEVLNPEEMSHERLMKLIKSVKINRKND